MTASPIAATRSPGSHVRLIPLSPLHTSAPAPVGRQCDRPDQPHRRRGLSLQGGRHGMQSRGCRPGRHAADSQRPPAPGFAACGHARQRRLPDAASRAESRGGIMAAVAWAASAIAPESRVRGRSAALTRGRQVGVRHPQGQFRCRSDLTPTQRLISASLFRGDSRPGPLHSRSCAPGVARGGRPLRNRAAWAQAFCCVGRVADGGPSCLSPS
jgi:hypothetical protein